MVLFDFIEPDISVESWQVVLVGDKASDHKRGSGLGEGGVPFNVVLRRIQSILVQHGGLHRRGPVSNAASADVTFPVLFHNRHRDIVVLYTTLVDAQGKSTNESSVFEVALGRGCRMGVALGMHTVFAASILWVACNLISGDDASAGMGASGFVQPFTATQDAYTVCSDRNDEVGEEGKGGESRPRFEVGHRYAGLYGR